jgi:PhzF family phenazine biosynthesis protein
MHYKVYVANAFAESKFGGNPAAVVPLQQWLSAELMQQVAAQNNLAETAFIIPQGNDYAIRWFTPAAEVNLCGHATLASAHILFDHLGYEQEKLSFHSKSGPLHVHRTSDGKITLDFPADKPVETAVPDGLVEGLKVKPLAVYKSTFDFMVVLNNQSEIEHVSPDVSLLKQLPSRGTIITAKGDEVDFVSRCFYPQVGVDEDHVTGSAHTVMVPYWAEILGKTKLSAVQLSARKGYLDCVLAGDRVLMSGHAHTYLIGDFFV